MMREAAEGFGLGLAMGGVCTVTCLPFLVPFLLGGEETGTGARARVFGAFLAGRLAAYLAVGALAGMLGGFFAEPSAHLWKGALLSAAAVLLLVFSARDLRRVTAKMDIHHDKDHRGAEGAEKDVKGGRNRMKISDYCPATAFKPVRGWPFVTGLLLGLAPCTPFVAALARGVELSDAAASSLFFLFLFAGSTVWLLPAPLIAFRLRSPFFRRVGCFFGILAGAWFLAQGVLAWF